MVSVGPTRAVPVSAGVDQTRITLGQHVGIEPEPFEGFGAKIGQEDVGGLEEPIQHDPPGFRLDVQGDGALPSIGQCQGKVDAAGFAPDPLGCETAIRVTLEALDVDDVCAPVSQKRSRNRHEDPLCQFDHAYTFERSVRHLPSPLPSTLDSGQRPE